MRADVYDVFLQLRIYVHMDWLVVWVFAHLRPSVGCDALFDWTLIDYGAHSWM
jgi:hypothetical protein